MRYLISVAVLGLAFGSGSALAQDGQPKVGQKFGDWVFQCSAVAQNQTDCAFVQTIVTPDGKRQLAQLQMLEQKTVPGTYILTVVLPLGLDLQNGVTARIDQTDPVLVTLKTCLPRGCIASMPLDEVLGSALRNGNALELAFTVADGKKTATVTGSLTGIDEAFSAAAWF
jgi:invasion protein IalB